MPRRYLAVRPLARPPTSEMPPGWKGESEKTGKYAPDGPLEPPPHEHNTHYTHITHHNPHHPQQQPAPQQTPRYPISTPTRLRRPRPLKRPPYSPYAVPLPPPQFIRRQPVLAITLPPDYTPRDRTPIPESSSHNDSGSESAVSIVRRSPEPSEDSQATVIFRRLEASEETIITSLPQPAEAEAEQVVVEWVEVKSEEEEEEGKEGKRARLKRSLARGLRALGRLRRKALRR